MPFVDLVDIISLSIESRICSSTLRIVLYKNDKNSNQLALLAFQVIAQLYLNSIVILTLLASTAVILSLENPQMILETSQQNDCQSVGCTYTILFSVTCSFVQWRINTPTL